MVKLGVPEGCFHKWNKISLSHSTYQTHFRLINWMFTCNNRIILSKYTFRGLGACKQWILKWDFPCYQSYLIL